MIPIVIGAGPSGLMAAVSLAEQGRRVVLIEQNPRIGCKLSISGGGRCNLTNLCTEKEFLSAFGEYKNFFKPAFLSLSNYRVIEFFENNGLPLVEEDAGRVFPRSGRAEDVVIFFERLLANLPVELVLECRVENIFKRDGKFVVVGTRCFETENLIIATGGLSFSSKCNGKGDGLFWARNMGHKITKLIPHLCGLTVSENVAMIKGISLKHVGIKHHCSKHKINNIGSIIFTETGLSGPVIHNISRFLLDCEKPILYIDFFPDFNFDELQHILKEDIKKFPKRAIGNILAIYQPRRLAKYIIVSCGLANKMASDLGKSEIHNLINLLKRCPFNIVGGPPLEWAFVTAGGISVKEINSKTMESKIVPGLYFVGEVLEPVGPTGGFNIQFALSTGYLAGKSVGCRQF